MVKHCELGVYSATPYITRLWGLCPQKGNYSKLKDSSETDFIKETLDLLTSAHLSPRQFFSNALKISGKLQVRLSGKYIPIPVLNSLSIPEICSIVHNNIGYCFTGTGMLESFCSKIIFWISSILAVVPQPTKRILHNLPVWGRFMVVHKALKNMNLYFISRL